METNKNAEDADEYGAAAARARRGRRWESSLIPTLQRIGSALRRKGKVDSIICTLEDSSAAKRMKGRSGGGRGNRNLLPNETSARDIG